MTTLSKPTHSCSNPLHGSLSVIVASYNQAHYLKMTIDSLLTQTYHSFELILADNDSTDLKTLDYLKQLTSPDPSRVKLTKVSTYPSGHITHTWNTGIQVATGEYIAILNNDITLSKHWDIPLMDVLQDEDVWLANPYQTDPGEATPYALNLKDDNIYIRGACFMFKKSLLEKTGYFPEQLKLWFSDMWLAWVVTKKYQKRSVFVDQSVIYHAGSKSSEEYRVRNKAWWSIIREDALAYQRLTEENIGRYLELVEARMRK